MDGGSGRCLGVVGDLRAGRRQTPSGGAKMKRALQTTLATSRCQLPLLAGKGSSNVAGCFSNTPSRAARLTQCLQLAMSYHVSAE